MDNPSQQRGSGITRRGFLLGTGVGLAAGISTTWLAMRQPFTGRSKEIAKPENAMPGPFPGRVVEVKHPDSVKPDNTVNAGAVKTMMDQGMRELTGADHATEAWRR